MLKVVAGSSTALGIVGRVVVLGSLAAGTLAAHATATSAPAAAAPGSRDPQTPPALIVSPPADAVAVEKQSPLDGTVNFTIASTSTWADVPAMTTPENVPRGTVTMFTMRSEETQMFPGVAGPYTRNVWVYVLAMAWFHPDWYHRVISYSGTFVNIQNNAEFPRGAWAYHEALIPNTAKKPLRVWLEAGSRDNGFRSAEDTYRNWPLANNRMAEALKAKRYAYQYVWAQDAGHVERGVERQTLEEAMEWVWKRQ